MTVFKNKILKTFTLHKQQIKKFNLFIECLPYKHNYKNTKCTFKTRRQTKKLFN